MKKTIMMVLALLSSCYIIYMNFINLDSSIKSFKLLKEHSYKIAIINSVSIIADVLLGLSIIAIVLHENTPKFKIIKQFVLTLLILTYCYANLNTLSGTPVRGYTFDKNVILFNALLYLSTIISVSAIALYALSNILLYSSTRKYAKYYCLISTLISYLITWSWTSIGTKEYTFKLTATQIRYLILHQLAIILILLYGLREHAPSSSYIVTKLPKKTKNIDTTSVFYLNQNEQVSITVEKLSIEEPIGNKDIIQYNSTKIGKKYIYMIGIFVYIVICVINIFSELDKYGSDWLALSVLFFFLLFNVSILLFIDKRKHNTDPKGKVLKKVLIALVSILFISTSGYYTVYKIDDYSFSIIYRLLKSEDGKQKIEVVYVKDGTSTRVYNGSSGLNLEFTYPLLDSKRSLYLDKVNKGSRYMAINVSGKYEIELYPYDNDSIIMKVNKAKGIDVTYLLKQSNFDIHCENLYTTSGYKMLKKDYEDIPMDMKKQLLNAALSSLESTENIHTWLKIDDRYFQRHKDTYGHSKWNEDGMEYYKEGFLYKNSKQGNYKVKLNLNTELYLQKEADYIDILKEVIEQCKDEFKLKDKDENGKHIIYVQKKVSINSITTHYFLDLTFIDQELTSLFLTNDEESFKLQTEKGYGVHNSLYEYLRYPTDLNTYVLKE